MIIPYDQSWKQSLTKFSRLCFGDKQTELHLKIWHWLYDENPYPDGTSPVFIFPDSDAVLGLLGTIPVRLKAGNSEHVASWGIDIMVHPEYRHAGIGAFLIRAWDDITPISLSLGVTDAAFDVFKSSERVYAGTVPIYKKLISPAKLIQKRLGSSWLSTAASRSAEGIVNMLKDRNDFESALKLEKFEAFDETFDDLWARISSEYPYVVCRTSEYLNWRFNAQPEYDYDMFCILSDGNLQGYVVTHLIDNRNLVTGYIADIFCKNQPTILEYALFKAVEHLKQMGADVVECLASHDSYRRALRKVGFIKRPSPTRLLFKVNNNDQINIFHSAKNLRAWHITYADSDCLTVIQNTVRTNGVS